MPTKTCALIEQLQTIADPRRQCANLKHPLVDVIMLGFCGVLAGCEDFVEIAAWGEEQQAVLATFLELPAGIPSHDTLNRVFAVLSAQTLQAVLVPWLLERRGLPGEWIQLDGKTLRGTRCKRRQLKALHVVSAWAGQTGLTLGQVEVDTKSNEIKALSALLQVLDLQDKIVTIDAMGCQTELAQAIVAEGGDYVLAVKGNQPTLHAEVQAAFAQAPAAPLRSSRRTTTRAQGHGRREQRTVEVLPAREYLSAAQQVLWVGVVRWYLGSPDQAQHDIRRTLTLAGELAHPHNQALALSFAAEVALLRREGLFAEEQAKALIALAREHGFLFWEAQGTAFLGGALVEQGQAEEGAQLLQRGIAACRETGSRVDETHFLGLLAEAHRQAGQLEKGATALAEAFAIVQTRGEGYYAAELYRIKGEVLLNDECRTMNDERQTDKTRAQRHFAQAEACFQKALDIARQQQAKSLELRAGMSLSRLWQQQGKKDDAQKLLADIYGWFSEGFATKDLQEAKALLAELSR